MRTLKTSVLLSNIMKLFKVSFGPGETADIEIVGISDNTLKQIFFYQGPRSNFDIGGAH